MKILEPKAFEGTLNAKEVENFLFDLEQYFQLANTDSKDAKVIMSSIYFLGNAKYNGIPRW